MPKSRPQIEIGKRAFEEVNRLFNNQKKAKVMLGISSQQLLYDWMEGVAPSAKYLQRLHYLGADVIYILTGDKKMSKKAPIEVGYRTYEEFCRIFEPDKHGNMKRSVQIMGCDRKTPYEWKCGSAPDAIYLARLCELGADVVYILTGRRR